MHDFTARTLHRIDRFVEERLPAQLYRANAPVELTAWEVPDEPVGFAEAVGQQFVPFEVGSPWSKPWGTTWFHVRGTVPADWAGQSDARAEVVIDLGFAGWGPGFTAEGQAWSTDGTMIKAVHPTNRWVPIEAAPGEAFEFYLEAAANPVVPERNWYTPTPMGDKSTAGTDPIYTVKQFDLGLLDEQVWELAQDIWALRGLVGVLPESSTRRAQIIAGLADMLNAVDPTNLAATAANGRALLKPLLDRKAGETSHTVHAVGHAHIDSAWLWPVRETQRKCARTFGNVVDLMDRHPELTFACSSAQQYEWVRDAQPALFAKIKHYVEAGRFVPVGGMWVESDTNMPGGEALARQFVLGTNFFIDEFGFEPKDVWLPDSFGYTAAMPQIARLAGKTNFLTQKISWNDTNKFPHSSFWWEGIDGTRIFTHFPPSDTYNSCLSAEELHRSERQFHEKARAVHALVPFGWGDGGGGPTREMVAASKRVADLEGSPKVVVDTPAEFFEAAKAEFSEAAEAGHDHLDVWSGEMYLEYHRGTYTSQHPTKAGNRRSEHLLREAELWWTTAAVRLGADYPTEALNRIWKLVLLQQFHDILPGSSIAWVHRDGERNYAAIATDVEALIDQAIALLAGEGDQQLAFNARPQADHGVAALGAGVATACSAATVTADGEGFVLATDTLRVVVDEGGVVTSLVDQAAGRELVPAGQALGLLQLHRDMPNEWDAWDINHFYKDVVDELTEVDSIEVVEGGLKISRHTDASTIVQTLTLDEDGLRFGFDIDWHERQALLKLALPLDVHAEKASSEIQFGHINRPTTVNTSWDAARFETIAHRWLHVGENGYGVAVANSATYGYDVNRVSDGDGHTSTVVRPSLLRAPLFPDPEADQGRHQLEYLLVPGAEVVDAVEAGYALNLGRREVSGANPVEPIVTVDNPAVVVEAVKLAEDGSGDVVVRLYESLGGRAKAVVTPGFQAKGVTVVDLLERELADDASVTGREGASATLSLRPFQIVTLRYTR